PPPPGGTAVITGNLLGSIRNDFTGWLGTRLVIGPTPMTVSHLARLVAPGNSGVHIVKLVNAATGLDVPGGSASDSMAGNAPGAFAYGALASPITLAANSAY